MILTEWLARAASRLWRRTAPPPSPDPQRDRRLAARSLRSHLPPHLRRDIGADDG